MGAQCKIIEYTEYKHGGFKPQLFFAPTFRLVVAIKYEEWGGGGDILQKYKKIIKTGIKDNNSVAFTRIDRRKKHVILQYSRVI